MSFPVTVTAELYDFDLGTLIATLDNAIGITFMDELSGPGTGQLSLPLLDANAADLVSGRYIQIRLNGSTRFTFRIEGRPQFQQIDVGEEVAQVLTVSGRGLGGLLDDAIIRPEFNLDLPLDSSWRLFSCFSPNYPNAGTWGDAVELYEYRDGVAAGLRYEAVADAADVVTFYPSPIGFPWPNSPKNGNGVDPTPTYIPTYWIWPDSAAEGDEGYAFFRDSFTLATDQPVTFSVTGDNLVTLYLEGVPILGEANDTLMWLGFKEVTIWLPGGTYMVGAVVQNIETDLAFNPGGFLYAAYVSASDEGGETVAWVQAQVSNSSWKATFSATTWPGWTPGQIVSQVLSESAARDFWALVDGGVGITETWDPFLDSGGNDWDSLDAATTSEFVPSFAIEVGKTMLDLMDQLHNEGWVDWHMQGDKPFLDMWTAGEAGTSTAVSFTAGTNIVGLERGATKPYANSLLVQWAKGFTVVEDAAAITALGYRVEDLYRTDAESLTDAQRLGRIELARRTQAEDAAIIMVIEPTSSADAPYQGFDLGDYVSIPQADGTGTESKQVLSISCQQDEEGYAVFTMELGRRWQNKERDISSLLRSIGGKTLGSAADHGVVD